MLCISTYVPLLGKVTVLLVSNFLSVAGINRGLDEIMHMGQYTNKLANT
jgi:hypothetical protein